MLYALILHNPTGSSILSLLLLLTLAFIYIILYQGGETIRQLQVQSGCHIELDRGPDMNPNEKIFNIRGTAGTFVCIDRIQHYYCACTI